MKDFDAIVGQFAPAYWNQSGGESRLHMDGLYVGNWAGAAGTEINLSGGVLTMTHPVEGNTPSIILGVRSNASLNISGTAEATIPLLKYGHNPAVTASSVTAVTNLDGGTLVCGRVFRGGNDNNAIFNFNGGQFRVMAGQPGEALFGQLAAVNVRDGGARIDTDGNDAEIDADLLHSADPEDGARDGGLVKTGAGRLKLNGANTYTGDTVVAEGEFMLGSSGSLTIVPGANGVSNKITGAGSVELAGPLAVDLSGAALADGNQWTLVDAAQVRYTQNFGLTGFDFNGGGRYVMVDGARTWTFEEGTGVLSLELGEVDDDYEVWAMEMGLNPSAPHGARAADFDGDGVSNEAEWLFGLDPKSGASLNPISAVDRETGTLTYTRRKVALTGASYGVEWSVDLTPGGWTRVTPAETVVPIEGTDLESVTVVLGAMPGQTRAFLRIAAEAP